MNKATLIFPDVISMSEFILTQTLKKAETKSIECKLTALLNDDQIRLAKKVYGAKLKACTLVKQ